MTFLARTWMIGAIAPFALCGVYLGSLYLYYGVVGAYYSEYSDNVVIITPYEFDIVSDDLFVSDVVDLISDLPGEDLAVLTATGDVLASSGNTDVAFGTGLIEISTGAVEVFVDESLDTDQEVLSDAADFAPAPSESSGQDTSLAADEVEVAEPLNSGIGTLPIFEVVDDSGDEIAVSSDTVLLNDDPASAPIEEVVVVASPPANSIVSYPGAVNSRLAVMSNKGVNNGIRDVVSVPVVIEEGVKAEDFGDFDKGMRYFNAGAYELAIPYLKWQAEFNVDNVQARTNLRLAIRETEGKDDLKAFYEDLITRYPDRAAYRVSLGTLFMSEFWDLDSARRLYEEALVLDPGEKAALYNLDLIKNL